MGLPSLSINPDARGAGMGNVGLTTSADAYSLFNNMSKMGFTEHTWGLAASYTPWMTALDVRDMSYSALTGYYAFVSEGGMRHALSGSLRYFRVGETLAFSSGLVTPVTVHPYELSVDLGYALRFTPQMSVGAALRYGISDYNVSYNGVISRAATLLGDLSFSYFRPVSLRGRDVTFSAAVAVNNIGGKLTHDGGKSYLFSPAVMRIGVGAEIEFSALHRLGLHLESSKFLVPTYPGNGTDEELAAYYAMNVAEGLFRSFGDAKGGSAEELKEVAWGIGLEYAYAERLYGRAGFFYQSPEKGTGSGLTLGAGVKYEMVTLDFSYLAATNPDSPLNNTLRIAVSLDF